MVSSQMYRFVLVALLPVIALMLYLEGQKYDPALIRFKPSEPGSGTEASFLPREIDGFSQAGQVRTYTKETLYEYVNGHAEYFISAGFVSLSVGDYIKTGSNPDQPDAVMEIYDMGKSIHAFGILADEAGENLVYLRAGVMGFKNSQGSTFFTGKYYVKINTFNDDVPVDKFVESIRNNIGAKVDSFPVFSRFPDLGKVITTRYIKEAYRGLGFVNNVIEREYSVKGNTVQVFLVTGESDKINELTASFLDFFRQSEIEYVTLEKYDRKFYKVMDPYEGNWYLLPLGDALFGIYGADDDNIVKHFNPKSGNA